MRQLLICLMLLWPAALHAASPVPAELYAEVDHGLRPATVLADPVGYRDRTLLLGGRVERTVSEPGRVRFEMACYAVGEEDRPLESAQQLGHVLVTVAGFDGAQLQPGRLVTLIGVVAGSEKTEGGDLPLLVARFVHPWPTADEEQAARAEAERLRYRYDPWCDPWYRDAWCGPNYYGPYPRWRFGINYHRHRH